MKMAFLGLKQAIDYFQIGGVENFVRRLAGKLTEGGNGIDYIIYGNKDNRELRPSSGITLKYFKSFNETLGAISNNYEHVIAIYLLPANRLKYHLFRKRNKMTLFHFVYFNWPDLWFKRVLYLNEPRIFPYNGKLFCISKRQYEYVSRWANNAVYLLPPVSKNYFLRTEEKPINAKIKVSFLGRIDPRKGIDEVIDIFKALQGNERLEFTVCGIHFADHGPSVEIHNWLKQQNWIKYIEIDRQNYSPQVEVFVREVLKETDILIQPYRRLSSTIDTPLLLLEGMASLCAVLTKPFGNIPDIYGNSKFIVAEKRFVNNAINLLKDLTMDDIVKERERLYDNNLKLDFDADNSAGLFLKGL